MQMKSGFQELLSSLNSRVITWESKSIFFLTLGSDQNRSQSTDELRVSGIHIIAHD